MTSLFDLVVISSVVALNPDLDVQQLLFSAKHTAMSKALFEGVDHARLYNLFRRAPPQILITKIINYVKEKLPSTLGNAVDVGCGTGQSTEVLSPYFKKVIGCDVSEAQIQQAKANRMKDNVEYFVSPAEELPFPDGSVDMVLSVASLHWFNHEKFFAETQRILVSGGVLAVAGQRKFIPVSEEPNKNLKLEILYKEIFQRMMKPFVAEQIQLFTNEFKDIVFPFDDLQRESGIKVLLPGTGADLAGYHSSTSFYQRMKETNPEQASRTIECIQQGMAEILGVSVDNLGQVPLNYRTECFLILGRKPAAN